MNERCPPSAGTPTVLKIAVSTLAINYLAAAAALTLGAIGGHSAVVTARRGAVALVAAASGWTVYRRAAIVEPEDASGVYRYYMHLWKCFYVACKPRLSYASWHRNAFPSVRCGLMLTQARCSDGALSASCLLSLRGRPLAAVRTLR